MKVRPGSLLKLSRHYVGPGARFLGPEEEAAVLDVIRNKTLFRYSGTTDPHTVNCFESMLARQVGSSFALALSSGTAALYVALKALGVGHGDRVIVPCFNFISPYLAIKALHAEPVFADVDETLNIDPAFAQSLLFEPTKAMIVTHMLGSPCAMDELLKTARTFGVPVIEDCAQAFGSTYHNSPLGSLGDIGIFSFQSQKLITCGEGGAVTTSRREIFRKADFIHDNSQLRKHRELPDDPDQCLGLNFRMDELRAAVLVEQMKKVNRILYALRQARQFLTNELSEVVIEKPSHDPDGDNCTVFAAYAQSARKRLWAQAVLKSAGFESHNAYGGPLWSAWPHVVSAPLNRSCFHETEDRLDRLLCVNLQTDFSEARLKLLGWILKHTLAKRD